MTTEQLINLSRRSNFSIGNYAIMSQDPNAVSEADRNRYVPLLLPQFLHLWRDIEEATGYRWKCTSYIRQSPSHRKAMSIDLAPDVAPEAEQHYGVYKGSDPVLYKRSALVRSLQTLRSNRYSNENVIGIFLESDHLHIQGLANRPGFPTRVIKWGLEKPIYSDTAIRSKLGSIGSQGLPLRQ